MSNELKKEYRRVLTIMRALKRIDEYENEYKETIKEHKRLLILFYNDEVTELEFNRIHAKYNEYRDGVRNYENMIITYVFELLDETDGELSLFVKTNAVQRQKFIKGVRAIFKDIETKNEVNIKELFEEVINAPKNELYDETEETEDV